MKTHIFKTHLFRDKKISRDVEIIENASLYKFAEAIVGEAWQETGGIG